MSTTQKYNLRTNSLRMNSLEVKQSSTPVLNAAVGLLLYTIWLPHIQLNKKQSYNMTSISWLLKLPSYPN